MKNTPLKQVLAPIAGISLAFADTAALYAAPAEVQVSDDKIVIEDANTKIKIKGDEAEAIANDIVDAEVQSSLVEGYVVPQQHRDHLHVMPEPTENVILRYYGNTVYYLDAETFEVQRVVTTPVPQHSLEAADPDKVKVRDNKVVLKNDDGTKVKIKGEDAEAIAQEVLTPEVQKTFVEGYIIPETYRTYLRPMPEPAKELTITYYGDRVYYMNPETYEIVRVVPLG